MNRRTACAAVALVALSAQAQVPRLDELMRGLGNLPRQPAAQPGRGAPDEQTSAAGIKEALAVGTENAVRSLSQVDGYFGNQAVRILMPPSIQKIADLARMAGFQQPVDDFVLRMNRAAEAAVPVAARHFGDAIRDMTLDDARGILAGGDTAATDFFRRRTHDKLYAAFRPIVSQKVSEAGATRAYKDLIGRYEGVALLGGQSLDLDDHVSNKALDGVYYMVAQEEKRIRTNPLARTTDLLKTVFGR